MIDVQATESAVVAPEDAAPVLPIEVMIQGLTRYGIAPRSVDPPEGHARHPDDRRGAGRLASRALVRGFGAATGAASRNA